MKYTIPQLIVFVGGVYILGASNPVEAGSLNLPGEGWVSWTIESVADAPGWCCYDWEDGRGSNRACQLDGKSDHYGSIGNDKDASANKWDSENMKVYVQMQAGKPQKIRSLNANCPVSTNTPIVNLSEVDTNDGLDWLEQQVNPRTSLSNDALAAIAIHAGESARQRLTGVAEGNSEVKNRREAIFWMGQVRGMDSGETLKRLMFNDPNHALREHAAFSLSQSNVVDRDTALIQLGHSDKHHNVRSQAWFWLSQTGSAEAEDAIFKAIDNEPDEKVQDAAIFALSQLPNERGLDALTRIVNNREASLQQRKQALFWMAQNDSPRALAYFDRILAVD